MKNADKPIYPSVAETINETEFTEYNLPHRQRQLSGLTKREYFAGLAMQGMLLNGGMMINGQKYFAPDTIAKLAIQQADELLQQLENTK
ncbi:hypothetical protein HZQ14_19385 [Elizabethkingia anophelis]|nr:hypothetical protein [Elizabethkingia anophelis]